MNQHSGPSAFYQPDGSHRRPESGPVRRSGDATDTSILPILRKKWRFIAALACAGLICSAIYVATAPSIYTAKARIYIESRSSPVTARDTPGAATPLEIPEVESQVEYIRSETIAMAAVRKLGFDPSRNVSVPSHPFIAYTRSAIGALTSFFSSHGPRTGDQKAPELRQATSIREGLDAYRVGAAYVIEVGYSLDDPAEAAAIANAVAEAYVSTQLENRSKLWKVAGEWMLQRLNELQQLASKASRDAQTYKAEHAIIDLGKRGLVSEQQLEELNTALAAARTKTVDARALRDQISSLLTTDIADPSTTEAFKDSVIVELRKRYVELLQRYDDLKRRLGPEHEAVLAVAKDIATVKQSLHSELARLAVSLEQDYRMAKSREDTTAVAFNELISKTLVTNNARVRAKELDRSAETYDSIYTNLLQRYVDAVNQQSYPQASAHVITPASVPERPSAPRSGLIVLLGTLIGAGAGVSAVFARSWLDRTLQSAKQLSDHGVTCLATLPDLQKDATYRSGLSRARATVGRFGRAETVEAIRANAVRWMPDSSFVDALYELKSNVLRAEQRGAALSIGFTSIGSGTGKTTIASNLALLLMPARSIVGGRALLVDADLRHATLSRLFRATEQRGLIDVLAHRCSATDAIRAQDGDVSLLPFGRRHHDDPHFNDLVTSEAIVEMMRGSRSAIDRIVVDLPPVEDLPALRPIVDVLDGLVIVVEPGCANVDDVVAAVQDLEQSGSSVLGVVINKVSDGTTAQRKPRYVDTVAKIAPGRPASESLSA